MRPASFVSIWTHAAFAMATKFNFWPKGPPEKRISFRELGHRYRTRKDQDELDANSFPRSPAYKRGRGRVDRASSGAAPAVDDSQLSAQFARVGVASVCLVIGSLLVVEIAQDRSGASTALPRRAFCGVAAWPELYHLRFGHQNRLRSRAMIKAASANARAMPPTA
jgi:hypothetical protein